MVVRTAHNDDYTALAFCISVVAHVALFGCMLFGKYIFPEDERPPRIIYSVTMESSNLLGGINQIPKTNQKTPIAPPKKVSAAPAKAEQAPQAKETAKKEEAKDSKPLVTDDEDAEVSLAEKKKEEKKKEEAKKATPAPTKAPEKKATPAPVAKATPAPVKPNTPIGQKNVAGQNNGRGTQNQMGAADIDRGYQQAMQRYLGASTNAGGQGFGGDGRGGSGMGGGVLRPPAWFIYKDKLEAHVKAGWNWHQPNAALKAAVTFRVSPSGVVSDVRISESSGNRLYDQSIVRAVTKASPVPIPPMQFYDDFKFVEIEFTPSM